MHGLARTLKDFLEQRSGITLESRSPLLAWLVEHCSNLLLLYHKGEPHDGHTAYMRLKGKPWRVEMPGFGECVDYRKHTRHKLESRWSRGVFVGVRVKTTERIIMDETRTYVVQSVRRVPEEQRRDLRLLQSVRGTPWEPNPGDVSSDMPEPMLITPTTTRRRTHADKIDDSDNKGTPMSTSAKLILKSAATPWDAQHAKYTPWNAGNDSRMQWKQMSPQRLQSKQRVGDKQNVS